MRGPSYHANTRTYFDPLQLHSKRLIDGGGGGSVGEDSQAEM